jgi:hypothetical protein
VTRTDAGARRHGTRTGEAPLPTRAPDIRGTGTGRAAGPYRKRTSTPRPPLVPPFAYPIEVEGEVMLLAGDCANSFNMNDVEVL